MSDTLTLQKVHRLCWRDSNKQSRLADMLAEAANMKARSELLSAFNKRIRAWDLPQEAAAARLGITRPRLNDLLRGKLGKFSLDALVNLATASWLTLEIRIADAA